MTTHEYPKPTPHPTRWTLAIWSTRSSGKPWTRISDYDTQDEAETALAAAQAIGERGYVVPPVKAWGGK